MSKQSVRVLARQFYRFVMDCLVSDLEEADLSRSAVVFAPHPDDETLGCGGTVIKKRRMAAHVRIVFLADGSHAPHDLVPAHELRSIRSGEALAASRKLGVEESDVIFLGFEDGKLEDNLDSVIDTVVEMLSKQEFEEIFIPYHHDRYQLLDHLTANRIVLSALQVLGQRTMVYEYPVWFWWRFWPWTGRLATSRLLTKSLRSSRSLLKDFRHRVYIGDVLELKRDALDQHKSQMTRFVPDPRWPTLTDVSDGEFLECFYQEYELFHRYLFPR